MPLKVLLADDSAAIRKVVQLSLQDFGVEVKAIGSGKDVLDVARNFQPDIAFVDVLLPHKTGYDVATEIKQDAKLKKIPVVMLWSSFMSFDESRFRTCGADDRLEKPFEVAGLRSIVNKFVPRTAGQPLAKHLEFPKFEFDIKEPSGEPVDFSGPEFSPNLEPVAPPAAEPSAAGASKWNMSSFEDISSFSAGEPPQTAGDGWQSDSEWVRKDLGKFRVDLPEQGEANGEISLETVAHEPLSEEHTQTDIHIPAPNFQKPIDAAADLSQRPSQSVHTAAPIPIDREAITAETKRVIEEIVWKIVPELATRLIKEEIQRLLDENPKA